MTLDAGSVQERMAPVADMLRADGFDLDVRFDASAVEVTVLATESACEECLVPKDVLAGVVRQALGSVLHDQELVVTYPADRRIDGAR